MRNLPFFFTPERWLLTGADRERARLYHQYRDNLDSIDLALALLDIDYVPGSLEHKLRVIELDLLSGKIDEYTAEIETAKLQLAGDELAIKLTHIDGEFNVISEQEVEKQIATIRGEAWVGGPVNYSGEGGVYFDLDWNEYWIEELKANGYQGDTDDAIMKKWFAALCYSEIIEQHGGADMDPFLYESARAAMNKIIGKD